MRDERRRDRRRARCSAATASTSDGVFFAIVDDDVLYLRVDDENRADFEALGCDAVRVHDQGRRARQAMSYLRAPDEALERPDAMGAWARSSLGAALRAAAAKQSRAADRNGRASRA